MKTTNVISLFWLLFAIIQPLLKTRQTLMATGMIVQLGAIQQVNVTQNDLEYQQCQFWNSKRLHKAHSILRQISI